MVTVSQVLKEGYSSLAKRARDNFKNRGFVIATTNPEIASAIQDYEQALVELESSGEITSLDDRKVGSFAKMKGVLEAGIPYKFTLTSKEACLGAASDCVAKYYGYSLDQLSEKLGIDELSYSPESSYFCNYLDKNRLPLNRLVAYYNPETPISSLTSNIYTLAYPLSPEYRISQGIIEELQEMKVFPKLAQLISSDLDLKTKSQNTIHSSPLRFFTSPQFIQKAKNKGIDLNPLFEFLEANQDNVNYCSCIAAGKIYVNGADLVSMDEYLRESGGLDIYKQYCFLDALQAPLKENEKNLHEVGVGIAEYLRKTHEKETFLGNKTFLRELTDLYFPVCLSTI